MRPAVLPRPLVSTPFEHEIVDVVVAQPERASASSA
jgi:hypothetical protein